jgi:hypothetical protein
MSNIYVKQSSFANGEVSYDMWGRDDYAKYFVSANILENFIPLPYGGAQNRPGTKFIAEVKDSSKKVKLLPFQFSVEQAYVIEAGENYFRYYKDGGQIIDPGISAIVETTTTYDEDYLFNLKTAQSADTLYLCNPNYKPKTLTRSSHYDWTLADFSYENGPFRVQNITDTTITPSSMVGTGITLTASTSIFTADQIGSLFQISHDVTNQIINKTFTSTTATDSIKCNGSWAMITHGSWAGKISLQWSKDSGATWQTIRTYTSNSDTNVNDSGKTTELVMLRLNYSKTSGTCYADLNAYSFVNDGIVKITGVTSGTIAIADVLTRLVGNVTVAGKRNYTTTVNFIAGDTFTVNGVTFTATVSTSSPTQFIVSGTLNTTVANLVDSMELNTSISSLYSVGASSAIITLTELAPGEGNTPGLSTTIGTGTVTNGTETTSSSTVLPTKYWAEGAWSTKNGYPSCAKFYQNRLGFAGSIKDPLTLWLSQTGDYPNFLVNTPTEDSDSITAPLVSEGVNSIRSMVSIGNMIAFTAGGTWKIGTGSESAALTPTTVRALQQGYIGASILNPIIVGSRILYCQEMGSTIRDISYQLADDVYKGDDMTMLARHLFKNHEIVDWAFQQEPDGIIWAVREDGVLLSFTYNKEQDVYAWARHITDGEYESVAAIPGNGYTEIYFVVRREINGVYKRYIEKLVPRMVSTDPRDQFFVDCGLTLDNPITITGATKASTIVITAVAHGLVNGNFVDISDIKGMTELNGMRYKVANKTNDTFQLVNMDTDANIDGTSYTSYKSSGYARKCVLTVSGLNHLEDKTVTILADGSVNSQQVVSGGSITLDDYASRVHVGLGYDCNLETLNLDFPMKDGTVQGRTKAIRNVTVRFANTYGGFVGTNGDSNLEVIEQILSSIMGKPGDLFTGDKKSSPRSDFDTNATVYIRQSDPLPMTVLAIMSEVEFGA